MRTLTIDSETADRITALNLKDYASYLKKELKKWKKNPKTDSNPDGYWLHPEDVAGNIRRIEAIEFILKDFPDAS
jgi:hypothetical protein